MDLVEGVLAKVPLDSVEHRSRRWEDRAARNTVASSARRKRWTKWNESALGPPFSYLETSSIKGKQLPRFPTAADPLAIFIRHVSIYIPFPSLFFFRRQELFFKIGILLSRAGRRMEISVAENEIHWTVEEFLFDEEIYFVSLRSVRGNIFVRDGNKVCILETRRLKFNEEIHLGGWSMWYGIFFLGIKIGYIYIGNLKSFILKYEEKKHDYFGD